MLARSLREFAQELKQMENSIEDSDQVRIQLYETKGTASLGFANKASTKGYKTVPHALTSQLDKIFGAGGLNLDGFQY